MGSNYNKKIMFNMKEEVILEGEKLKIEGVQVDDSKAFYYELYSLEHLTEIKEKGIRLMSHFTINALPFRVKNTYIDKIVRKIFKPIYVEVYNLGDFCGGLSVTIRYKDGDIIAEYGWLKPEEAYFIITELLRRS